MSESKTPTASRRFPSPLGRSAARLRSALCALLPAAAMLVPTVADARVWPLDDAQWTPLTKDGVPIGDPLGDGAGERDIVGDATNPAAYVYSDLLYLYFRLRVDAKVLQTATNFKPFGWACLIDTDANLQSYEFIVGVDGIKNPDVVEFYQNTTPTLGGNPKDVAETLLVSYPAIGLPTYAREAAAASMFGGNADVFIDWAIPKTDLLAAGITDDTPLRIICGTSNNASSLTADLISESGATTLPDLVTDPVTCGATGCDIPCAGFGEACTVGVGACAASGTNVCDPKGMAMCNALPGEPSEETCDGVDNDCNGMVDEVCNDQDGDGLSDAQETTLGSNPNDADTDDDGVPDNEELEPGADADKDGKPNIADPDADGDGLFDGTEMNKDCSGMATDPAAMTCIADADPTTATDPLNPDTDGGGEPDGSEDANHDGKLDANERDPNVASDDVPPVMPECTEDADCDSATGSMVCDTMTQTCVAGCRGNTANTCPAGQACSSTNDDIGECRAVESTDGYSIEGNGFCAAQPGANAERTLPFFLGLLGSLALLRRRRSGR